MKRKLYAIILGICLVFTQVPMIGFADAAPGRTEEPVSRGVTKLFVGGVDAFETPQGDGWSFDEETSTLTLNNCTINSGSYIIPAVSYDGTSALDSLVYAEGQLIIELIGDNYIERDITTVASEYTSYRAITVYGADSIPDDAPEEEQWELYIKGKGSLTTGVAFDRNVILNSDYVPYAFGVSVDGTNGMDLRGLKDGGSVTIYGGEIGFPRSATARAMSNGPVWDETHTVIACQDLEGTIENDMGYNWNNNDAWNFKLITAPTYVMPSGILKILNDNPAEGEGWTWENEILTLDGGTGTLQMEGIEFGKNIDYAKIALESDVLLDASELTDTIPLMTEAEGSKLEIDAGNYTLTCKSSNKTYDSWSDSYEETSGTAIQTAGDLYITGGKVEAIGAIDEYGGYDIYVTGGDLVVDNAELTCPVGGIEVFIYYGGSEAAKGNITINNSVVNVQDDQEYSSGLYADDSIIISNSQVTVDSAYLGLNAMNAIEITDNSIVAATGDNYAGISSTNGLTIIESDVYAKGAEYAIEVGCEYRSLPETDILSLTDVEITTPENGEIKAFEYYDGSSTTSYYGKVSIFDGDTLATEVQIKNARECTHEGTTTVINVLTQTCGEEGYSGDLYCTKCDTILQYGEVIPPDEDHKYGDDNVCDVCGERIKIIGFEYCDVNRMEYTCGHEDYYGYVYDDVYYNDYRIKLSNGEWITAEELGGLDSVFTFDGKLYWINIEEIDSQDESNVWSLGNSYTLRATLAYQGNPILTDEFEVNIVENQIEAINILPITVKATEFENWNVRPVEDYFLVDYYYYDYPYEVILKDGSVISSGEYGFVSIGDIKYCTINTVLKIRLTGPCTGDVQVSIVDMYKGYEEVEGTYTEYDDSTTTIAFTCDNAEWDEGTLETLATTTNDGEYVYRCNKLDGECQHRKIDLIPRISTVELSFTEKVYTGTVIEAPILTVRDAEGKDLVPGTDYTVEGLTDVTDIGTYEVVVTFMGNYGGSETLTYKVLDDKLPAPENLKASNVSSSGKIKLTWDEVEGAEKYKVYRATSKSGTYKLMKTTKGTSYTNTSAEAGTLYYYKVCALDADGKAGDFSSIVSRRCDCARPEVTATNVASSGKIKLTWEEVDGAKEYKVYRATSKTGTYKLMKTTEGTSYANTGAEAGKLYYYKVKAMASNSAADSAYSEIVSRRCDCARPEVTASNVASSGKIKLTWAEVEGAEEYKVYRATSKSGTYKLMKTTSGTSYTNTGATAGKTYYYKVKAIASNTAANSAYSTVVSRTCDYARPVVSISLKSSKPYLTWKEVDGAEEYKVYRATSKSGTYKLMKTTEGTSYRNSGAASGKTYYYKVKAYGSSSAATSAYSTVKSITSK